MSLPVNASNGDSNPTKWRLSKYLVTDSDKLGLGQEVALSSKQAENAPLNTMDAIRLFHREIGGYLTVTRREVESNLPEFPDFLKKEVAVLAKEKDDLEEEDEEDIVIEEGKVEQEILIYIEKDSAKLDKTNSLWEVQKVGSVVGDTLKTNEKYLLRHVGTGMYLSTSDHIELSLTSQSNNAENEFQFKSENTYTRIKSEINDKDLVCLQNIDEKLVQTYIDIQQEQFNYANTRNISTEVPIVCGFKHGKEVTKEAFIIEKADDDLKLYTQKAHSIYFYLLDSYRYINQWAVIKEDEEGELYDKYDELMATTSEEHLQEKVTEISSVLDLLIQDLSWKDKDVLYKVQTYYSEQGILEILLRLAELNYYKSTRVEERVADLLGKAQFRMQAVRNLIQDNLGDDEIRPETIADDYLRDLNAKILRVVYLLIVYNTENCNTVTKYDQLVYKVREPEIEGDFTSFKPMVGKILIETFKRATFIHDDKAAVMGLNDGLDYEAITNKLIAGVATTADKKLVNQMSKWLDMLDMIYFSSEEDHNIYQQVLYVKIIAMHCVKTSRSAISRQQQVQGVSSLQDTSDFEWIKGHKRYQLLAGKFIFATEKSIPLKFGYEHRATEIPYVTFQKRGGKDNAFFLDRNPILEELFRSDAGNENQDNSFTFEEISEHEKILMPYIDYICAVVELYAHLWLDGNIHGNLEAVTKAGISFTHVISTLKNDKIHLKIRNSYAFLARVLFLDIEPFISIMNNYNRCYFWDSLDLRADQTVTNWDKIKIESVNFNENYDAMEKKLNNAKQIRKFISSTCYNHQGFSEAKKIINDKEKLINVGRVNTVISYINNLVEASIKVIEYGHADAEFIDDWMKFSAFVFLTDYTDYVNELTKNETSLTRGLWIIRFLLKAKALKGAKHRIEALVTSTCNMLKVVCKSRLNRQVLVFMQLFKGFVDNNDIPDVGSYIEIFSRDFEALFKIHNFTIQKPLLSIDMKKKIIAIKEQHQKQKEEELKRLRELDEEEEDEEEEIQENQEQGVKRIKQEDDLDEGIFDEYADSIPYAKNVSLTMHKNIIPLNIYLLKMIFSHGNNRRIQNKAIDILIDNFAQRKYFMDEIVKVELIITDQDVELYNQYKDHHSRVKKLMNALILDDLEYLLLQNVDKEKYKSRIRDTTIIIKSMRSTLKRDFNDKNKEEKLVKVHKSQNILRQFGIHVLLIKCMKEIYYRHNEHFHLFSAILSFLENFCWENKANQNWLLPHINYLLSLNQWDLDSAALISEILRPYRETEFGVKFYKFIVERVTQRNLYNAHLFNFLSVMTLADSKKSDVKLYIVNKFIKQTKLRELMMNIEEANKKVELLEVYHKKRRTLKDTVLLQEKEFLDAHIALVNLYAKCATKCHSAILQVRKIVEVDSIYNNLFSEAIPFLFKKVYFRFFFEVYIRTLPDIRFIDINDEKFVSLLTYVVLEDVKVYGQYLPGLLLPTPEEEESSMFNEAAQKRANLKNNLNEQATELAHQFDRDKQQREIDKFKDYKMKLSPITSTKSIPLYHDDKGEYWTYLTGKYGTEEHKDGLLHFLLDMFENIESNATFEMSKPLIETVGKIRHVLATMSDSLHLLYINNQDELPNVPGIISVLNYTLQKIPTTKAIKQKKKMTLAQNEDEINEEETENEDSKEENKEDLALTDQNSDVQKVLQLVRDHIIKGNLSIRQAFDLPDINVDYYLEFHEFKAMLKEIWGKKATYNQIENATEFIFKGTLKLEEDKKKADALAKILDKSYKEKQHSEMINFKYFEQIIRKILKKAGYKPTSKKRERDEEQRIEFAMQKSDIGVAITKDFRHYIKLYLQYQDLLDETSELELLFMPYFSKLLRKLRESVSKGVIGNETDNALVVYFKNLMNYIGQKGGYLYLLKIFIFIINWFDPKSQLNSKLYMIGNEVLELEVNHDENDRSILIKIQSLMNQAGVTRFTLDLITSVEDEQIANTGVNLLISLMQYSNLNLQKSILKLLKLNQRNVKFFAYIKQRIVSGYIKTRSIELDNPVYLEKDDQIYEFKERTIDKYNCYNILDLIQLFCSNCYIDFQNYLHDQTIGEDLTDKVSVDIISEFVYLLDRLTRQKADLFSDITASTLATKVLKTLVKVSSGPSFVNQKLLGHWKKLHRILNFYIGQELDNFAPITDERKVKIDTFCLSVELLRTILKTKSEMKSSIWKAMIEEINVTELINKLTKIHEVNSAQRSLLKLFQGRYEKQPEPEEKVFKAAFDIFIILIDLKLQHPFEKELLNLNLNIDLIFEVHEIVKPNYQALAAKSVKEDAQKIVKEKQTPFIEKLVAKSSKKMIKDVKTRKGKIENELMLEEEEKKTSRTDADEIDSDVSLIQTHSVKKKRKFRICCIPIKSTDGKCVKCFKFFCCWSCLSRLFQRSNKYKIANFDTVKKKKVDEAKKTEQRTADIMSNYNKHDFEITESLIYYLNHTASVEILTDFGLMKIYFPIPKSCTQMSSSMTQTIVDEMTKAPPQESIKYICTKALMIKDRLGVEKQASALAGVSRYLLFRVSILYQFMFLVLLVYLAIEVINVARGSSLGDVLKPFLGVVILITSLLMLFSNIMETYSKTKSKLNSTHNLRHKKKKVSGSLGYNAFPKDINNSQISYQESRQVRKRRIIFKAVFGYRNIFYFLQLLVIAISIVSYNQIFRAILLLLIASVDTRKVLRFRIRRYYPALFSWLCIVAILIMLAYVFALTEIFFSPEEGAPVNYSYDNCEDFWGCTGALLDNGINNDATGIERVVNFILFVVILITVTHILLTYTIAIFLRDQINVMVWMSSETGGQSSKSNVSSDICMICGKHRSEFDINTSKSRAKEEGSSSSKKTFTGWEDHISKEHNIFAYFYYIIYVTEKPDEECDGVELYVKKAVHQNDISFIPINMALSLQS